MGMGGSYLKMKEYEKSKFHLTKALEVNDLPAPVTSRIENDLGTLHLELKDFDSAETLLKSSLAIREANGLEDAACTTMTALAEVYLAQGKIDDVLHLVERCSLLVDKYQTKAKKLKLLNLMAKVHSHTKDYPKAVRCYEQYNVLYDEIKSEQERNNFKFKNEQIEKQKKIIEDKHNELAATFEEIKRLKVDRKASLFSWGPIILLFVISEVVLDPLIESYAYNNILSLLVKALIALMFKPIDGIYEKILWERTIRKVD
jgi:tetratricopeptide (TPR) repeat protein